MFIPSSGQNLVSTKKGLDSSTSMIGYLTIDKRNWLYRGKLVNKYLYSHKNAEIFNRSRNKLSEYKISKSYTHFYRSALTLVWQDMFNLQFFRRPRIRIKNLTTLEFLRKIWFGNVFFKINLDFNIWQFLT